MRAKADQIEMRRVRLAIDENEIGLDMAVTMIAPFAG